MTELTAEDPGNPKRTRRTLIATLIALSLAAAAIAVTWQLLIRYVVPMAIPPLNPARAAIVARRVEVVFDDAEQSWTNYYNARGRAEPKPAELVFFTRTQPSACIGAGAATGPFYCPKDDVAGFDLAFLDTLEGEMYRDAELGTAIVVARIIASHVQNSNGAGLIPAEGEDAFSRERVLQADCLAGVWAGMAEGRVGAIPAGFYTRLLSKAQEITGEIARSGINGEPTLSPFLLKDGAAREAAFARGYDAIDPVVCREFH